MYTKLLRRPDVPPILSILKFNVSTTFIFHSRRNYKFCNLCGEFRRDDRMDQTHWKQDHGAREQKRCTFLKEGHQPEYNIQDFNATCSRLLAAIKAGSRFAARITHFANYGKTGKTPQQMQRAVEGASQRRCMQPKGRSVKENQGKAVDRSREQQ